MDEINDKSYLEIITHYETCLELYGDNHRGVDWPKAEDVNTRYKVMLGLLRISHDKESTLLDFGCGASHLYDYIVREKHYNLLYSGLDLSEKFIALSKSKHPTNAYYCLDLLGEGGYLPDFDYIVMNGVFTEKRNLSFDKMFDYFQALVAKVFAKARIGIAFNVMSTQVDWEREDLFHLSLDELSKFLTNQVSRHFIVRHDYGLYEYTVYVYQQPHQD